MGPSALEPVPTIGIGTDLVRVSHIVESLDRFGQRFLDRVYTPDEITYAQSAPLLAPERLAARLAAKEAGLKALGLVDHGIGLTAIEVRRRESGACELVLHGAARAEVEARGTTSISVSLSHEGDYAMAVVVSMTTAS